MDALQGSDIACNFDMRMAEVCEFCTLDEAGDSLVRTAMSQMNLFARGYHRVLKLNAPGRWEDAKLMLDKDISIL